MLIIRLTRMATCGGNLSGKRTATVALFNGLGWFFESKVLLGFSRSKRLLLLSGECVEFRTFASYQLRTNGAHQTLTFANSTARLSCAKLVREIRQRRFSEVVAALH